MLLSNLTASPTACSALLSLNVAVIVIDGDPSSQSSCYTPQSKCGTCPAPLPYPPGSQRQVSALPLLVEAFVQGASVDPSRNVKPTRKGELHFLASVFANLSSVSIYGHR